MSDLTADGERLVQDWSSAKERVERARRELSSAECGETNSRNALSKWLLPPDAKVGEKIAIWHVDSLIQVEVTSEMPLEGKLTVRTRGKRGLSL